MERPRGVYKHTRLLHHETKQTYSRLGKAVYYLNTNPIKALPNSIDGTALSNSPNPTWCGDTCECNSDPRQDGRQNAIRPERKMSSVRAFIVRGQPVTLSAMVQQAGQSSGACRTIREDTEICLPSVRLSRTKRLGKPSIDDHDRQIWRGNEHSHQVVVALHKSYPVLVIHLDTPS